MAAWLNATQRPGDSALEDGRHDLVDATFHAAQTTALSPALPAHSPVSVPPAHPMLWKDNVGHADKPAVGIIIGLKTTAGYPDIDLYHALLNSLLGMFYIEAVGFGRGLGALDISSTTIRNAYMLKPNIIDGQQRERILEKFDALLQRDVYSTERELSEIDRIEFDHEVLRAYGIEQYYNDIKNSLLSMQRMRLGVR